MSSLKKRQVSDLKVTELRAALEQRDLDTKGLKAALIERLQKFLKTEGKDETAIELDFVADSSKRDTSEFDDSEIKESSEDLDPKVADLNGGDDFFDVSAPDEVLDDEGTDQSVVIKVQVDTPQPQEDSKIDHKVVENIKDDVVKSPDEKNLSKPVTAKPKESASGDKSSPDKKDKVKGPSKGEVKATDDKAKTATKATTTLVKKILPASAANDGRNLWITNLSQNTRATDLKSLFSKFGKVAAAKIVTNAKSPGSKCFGFVTMGNEKEALKCIENLNKTELNSNTILVDKATGKGLPGQAKKPVAPAAVKEKEKAKTSPAAKDSEKKKPMNMQFRPSSFADRSRRPVIPSRTGSGRGMNRWPGRPMGGPPMGRPPMGRGGWSGPPRPGDAARYPPRGPPPPRSSYGAPAREMDRRYIGYRRSPPFPDRSRVNEHAAQVRHELLQQQLLVQQRRAREARQQQHERLQLVAAERDRREMLIQQERQRRETTRLRMEALEQRRKIEMERGRLEQEKLEREKLEHERIRMERERMKLERQRRIEEEKLAREKEQMRRAVEEAKRSAKRSYTMASAGGGATGLRDWGEAERKRPATESTAARGFPEPYSGSYERRSAPQPIRDLERRGVRDGRPGGGLSSMMSSSAPGRHDPSSGGRREMEPPPQSYRRDAPQREAEMMGQRGRAPQTQRRDRSPLRVARSPPSRRPGVAPMGRAPPQERRGGGMPSGRSPPQQGRPRSGRSPAPVARGGALASSSWGASLGSVISSHTMGGVAPPSNYSMPPPSYGAGGSSGLGGMPLPSSVNTMGSTAPTSGRYLPARRGF